MKKRDGITLIALIITIVVLVILAGVTIRTISGNGGIIGNANKIAGKYNNKAKEEEDILGTFENKLKEYAGENGDNPSTPDTPAPEPTNSEYFNWTTTETEATITGFSDAGKQKYNAGEITKLVIPSEYNGLPVTTIGDNAFYNCTGITNISIPNSVTTIEGSAFYGCTGLTELFIPKTLTTVRSASSWGPFAKCSNIGKVEFEEGTTKIPNYILYEARLKSGVEIIIPNSVTIIESYAFSRCTGITNISIPNSITIIGSSAFNECTGITNISIPNSVTTIGNSAFYNCSNLNTVSFRGTEAQWNTISIGSGNEPLKSATKNFNQ